MHHKLPVKERLCRIGLAGDPYCTYCLGATICDYEHYFCSCITVTEAWEDTKSILEDLLGVSVENSCFISLDFPKSDYENEVTWILGLYVDYVWGALQKDGNSKIDRDKWFGFLKFKYKTDQLGARRPLRIQRLAI